MPNVKEIIQQMYEDGQPESMIIEFIEKYKAQQAGKTSDPVNVEASAGSVNNMASNLGNGSLDLDTKDRSIPKTPQGELVYGDQRNFDQQVADFQRDYNDALLGRGKFSFLADKPKEDRIMFADKMVSKPTYFSSVYNQNKDKYEVKPSKGMYDLISSYLPDDFNLYDTPEQFNVTVCTCHGFTEALWPWKTKRLHSFKLIMP